MSAQRQGPLSRFKVIDLTRARAGPTAARHFADFGADVIKVKMPTAGDDDALGGDRNGPDFFNLSEDLKSYGLKPPGLPAYHSNLFARIDTYSLSMPRAIA